MPYTPIITEIELQKRIPELAQEIKSRLGTDAPVKVLVLLHGGLWFGADLLRHLPENYTLDTIKVSSYGHGTTSSGSLKWLTPLSNDIKDHDVLIVDDILDSGLTLKLIKEELIQQGAKSVYSAVAICKNIERTITIEADFIGFYADNLFLIGYGMDYADKYRNLPFIAVLNQY